MLIKNKDKENVKLEFSQLLSNRHLRSAFGTNDGGFGMGNGSPLFAVEPSVLSIVNFGFKVIGYNKY